MQSALFSVPHPPRVVWNRVSPAPKVVMRRPSAAARGRSVSPQDHVTQPGCSAAGGPRGLSGLVMVMGGVMGGFSARRSCSPMEVGGDWCWGEYGVTFSNTHPTIHSFLRVCPSNKVRCVHQSVWSDNAMWGCMTMHAVCVGRCMHDGVYLKMSLHRGEDHGEGER